MTRTCAVVHYIAERVNAELSARWEKTPENVCEGLGLLSPSGIRRGISWPFTHMHTMRTDYTFGKMFDVKLDFFHSNRKTTIYLIFAEMLFIGTI